MLYYIFLILKNQNLTFKINLNMVNLCLRKGLSISALFSYFFVWLTLAVWCFKFDNNDESIDFWKLISWKLSWIFYYYRFWLGVEFLLNLTALPLNKITIFVLHIGNIALYVFILYYFKYEPWEFVRTSLGH